MTTNKVLNYWIVRDGWNKTWWLINGIGYDSLESMRKAYPGFRLKKIKVSPLYG